MKNLFLVFLVLSGCATRTDTEKGTATDFMVTYDADDSVAGAPTKLLKATNTGVTAYRPLTAKQGIVRSPYVAFTMDEGATKGISTVAQSGAAFTSTAAVLNHVYMDNQILGWMNIVDADTNVPVMDATGLDVTDAGAAPTDNDHIEFFLGSLGASGRPFTVGTDQAFYMEVTFTITDVSGTDFFYCGFRDAAPVTVSLASYTDFCTLGVVSGNYATNDKTTGATDSGADAIADTETDTWRINVSAGGVCSYKIDGVAVESADGHTLTDGLQVIPFCQLRHDTDLAEDTIMTDLTVGFQDAQNP